MRGRGPSYISHYKDIMAHYGGYNVEQDGVTLLYYELQLLASPLLSELLSGTRRVYYTLNS